MSHDEVDLCIRVLAAMAADPTLLAALDAGRRRELVVNAERVAYPVRDDKKRLKKALHRKQRRSIRAHDAQIVEATQMRTVRRAPVFTALPPPSDEVVAAGVAADPELIEPRHCYVCKDPFKKVHFFYFSLCPPCAALNYAKRTQSARLDGRVALVTGGRVKIGYQTALILLRAGAEVIVTTRFPQDAATRFAREPDFAEFAPRLRLHGLDLRHAPSVELFAAWITETSGRLDLLINNAAQTVRRPPAFYSHLLAAEEAPYADLPAAARPLLRAHEELKAALGGAGDVGPAPDGLMSWHQGARGIGLLAPARLSQMPCTPDDNMAAMEIFPPGTVDADLQQVDLRRVNSWRLTAVDVPTPELLEVHLVNAVAPFLLNSRLKPLMTRHRTDEKHIVNVSAMEAQFSRKKKTDKHPHTNMAKAALNMMTRTSGPDYAADGIWMNSVDTGWVTDEDPMHHVVRKQHIHDFHPPLDIIDGAARICDPIFTGLLTGKHSWGLFFKDYRPTGW